MVANAEALTVFNGRTDRGMKRRVYIPTVIKGVSYAEGKGSKVADNGVWSDDVQYKIRVPMAAVVQGGRAYIRDLSYAKMADGEAARYWTIQKGDMVIMGEYAGDSSLMCGDEIIAYAREQGLDLIHITEHADNTSGGSLYARHRRIGGK